jgi:hypothetical protein
MKTWYLMTSYGDPELVKVERETENFVFVQSPDGKTRRVAKYGPLESYFTSVDACWAWRISQQEEKVLAAKSRLEYEEQKMAELRAHVACVKGVV